MRLRTLRWIAVCVFASSVTGSAQEPKPIEVGEARLRYGVAQLRGSQNDSGPGVSYTGLTPDDLELSGGYWAGGLIGAVGSVERLGFGLFDNGTKVTAGQLWRASLGPSARLTAGALCLQVDASYQFAQVPELQDVIPAGSSASAVTFGTASRHGLLFAARARFGLPAGLFVEGSGAYTRGLATSAGPGSQSSGYGLGAAVGIVFSQIDRVGFGLRGGFEWRGDSLTTPALSAFQRAWRYGIALELRFLDRPLTTAPTTGDALITAVDAESGAPLEGLHVEVTQAGLFKPLKTEGGRLRAEPLAPGPVSVTASAPDHLPAQAEAVIVAGHTATVSLTLRREPRVGIVSVHVVDRDAATPIVDTSINLNGRTVKTDAAGRAVMRDVPEGNMQLSASATGYQPASEVASVVKGQTAEVEIKLIKAEQKLAATLTGTIRSTEGGHPVQANLEIPQARVKTKAGRQGDFKLLLEGGTYTVIISAPGYLTQSKSVTVKDGDEAIFNVDLHPERR